MGELRVNPASRMATPGSTAYFEIRVKDQEASTVRVVPCKEAEDYRAEFTGGASEARAGQGELTLAIRVPAKAKVA